MEIKKKVLNVEYNPKSRELVTIVISHGGYDVVEVSAGIEAVDHAHTIQCDHIFLGSGHADFSFSPPS